MSSGASVAGAGETKSERAPSERDGGIAGDAPDSGLFAALVATPEIALDHVNWVARLLWTWVTPFVVRHTKREVQDKDLYSLHSGDLAEQLSVTLERRWREEVERRGPAAASLLRVVLWVLGPRYLLEALWKPVWFTSALLQVYCLRLIVGYMRDNEEEGRSYGEGFLLCLFITLASIGQAVSVHMIFFTSLRTGIKARSALAVMLFKKLMRLHVAALRRSTMGEITNLATNDARRVREAFIFFHFLWFGMVEILVIFVLLFIVVGPAAGFGVLCFAVLIPLQAAFGVFIARARRSALKFADERVRAMDEIFGAISVIKFFAWERRFADRVAQVRNNECRVYKRAALTKSLNSATFFSAPGIIALGVFAAYVWLEGDLDAQTAFTSVALFNLLSRSLFMVPMSSASLSEGLVSLHRIRGFLLREEIAPPPDLSLDPQQPAVEMHVADWSWETPDMDASPAAPAAPLANEVEMDSMEKARRAQPLPLTLRGVSLRVMPRELVAVVGRVGSGKSSLMSALLGEMTLCRGELTVRGRVAYVPQRPWVFNASLRENVLFGQPFEPEWYRQVLRVCALEADVAEMQAGDLSEIGEKGINLSGGQKQRVALARACYARPDVVLLDDPLAAVDQHVGRVLFEQCICGAMAHAARVLVTHQLGVLSHPAVSRIFHMADGSINSQGTYEELHAVLLQESSERKREVDEGGEDGESAVDSTPSPAPSPSPSVQVVASQSEQQRQQPQPQPQQEQQQQPQQLQQQVQHSTADHGSTASANGAEAPRAQLSPQAARKAVARKGGAGKVQRGKSYVIVKEEKRSGKVTWEVYWQYFERMGGPLIVALVFGLFALTQAARIVSDYWLVWWSRKQFGLSNESFAGGYGALIVTVILLSLLRAISLIYSMVDAGNSLHDSMLRAVLAAPLRFFQENPIGRILNRFSGDMNTIDEMLPQFTLNFFQTTFVILGTIATTASVVPVLLAPLVLLVFVFRHFYLMYLASSNELRRLEALSTSPLFAHFAASAQGLESVRAFRLVGRFCARFVDLLDASNRPFFLNACVQRWLGVRLDLITTTVVCATAVFVVSFKESLNAGLAGVAIASSLLMAGLFQFGVRQAAEAETAMTAVERALAYVALRREGGERAPPQQVPADWPARGEVEFRGVTMRYREDLDPALRSVCFRVAPREKVGVVGRTGSGKSSLLQVLFRTAEYEKGEVLIDGLEIGRVALSDLRSRISVIPQDPMLFKGTLRSNLDPFEDYTDEDVWTCLERICLRDFVRALPSQLQHMVDEGGANLSVGQRQLLCLGRALLRQSRVIALDEATANVDLESDALIQRTIRSEFRDSTVLTIAHRLDSIIDYDRVLVMDAGEAAEYDSPAALLARPESLFARLVAQGGATAAGKLADAARTAERQRLAAVAAR